MRKVLLKRTKQFVVCLTLACVGLMASCKGDEPEIIPDLSLEKESVIVIEGDDASVNVVAGSGNYSVESASAAVATATIEERIVKISGVAKGSTQLTVTDTKSMQKKTIEVNVSQDLVVDALETVSITMGKGLDIAILAGSGDYAVAVANTAIASAVIQNGVIKVSSLTEGTTTLTVTDNQTDKAVTITLVCERIPSIYFAASATWNFIIKINAAPEDQPDVWIDLNNNGTKDEGEAVLIFDTNVTYTRNSEMTIYGKVTELTLASMGLERLDVTNNKYLRILDSQTHKLATIDLTKNTELEKLNISSSQAAATISSLDLSKNTKLRYLNCNNLKGIETLDVSSNTELKELYCTATNVKNIKLGAIGKVQKMDVWNNSNLEPFDIKLLTELTYLRIYGNTKFTSFLDVSKNTKLETIVAGGIDLSGATIDLSKNAALVDIYFYINKLKNVDFLNTIPNPEKMIKMQLEKNELTALNVSRFTNLTTLHCYSNKIAGDKMTALVSSLPTRTAEVSGTIHLVDKSPMASPVEGNTYIADDIAAIKAKSWKPYNQNTGGSAIPLN